MDDGHAAGHCPGKTRGIVGRGSLILAFGLGSVLVLALVAILPAGNITSPSPNLVPQDRPANLAEILERCAAYCDRLVGSVLDFVCEERVEETIAAVIRGGGALVAQGGETVFWAGPGAMAGKKTKSTFVYDYQLVRDKAGWITETRTLTSENGHKVEEKNAPLKTQIFKYRYIVMGPVGLLSRAEQQKFDYSIVKETDLKKERVMVIQAVPKPGAFGDFLYGKVWVRKKDAGILKIEWEPESMGHYDQIKELAEHIRMKPRLSFTSEYALEKNGIRFPSRYAVEEAYTSRIWRPLIRSKTEVTYDAYKFFTVETGVVIR